MELELLQGYDSYFDEDETPLEFCTDRKTIHYDGVKIILNRLPYLKKPRTGKIFFTTPAVHIIEEYLNGAKAKGKSEITINQLGRFNRGYLPIAENTKFKYSAAEHFFTPGLIRDIPSNGYLTPVYFNPNVLIKYQHGSGYEVTATTASFGVISIFGEKSIPYGINKFGSVIMWLGDIVDLSEKELLYLYSENTEPQYELHSGFYDNQILNKWL